MKIPTAVADLALALTVCPRCESKPTQECISVPSGKKTEMHVARIKPLAEVWKLAREVAPTS